MNSKLTSNPEALFTAETSCQCRWVALFHRFQFFQ